MRGREIKRDKERDLGRESGRRYVESERKRKREKEKKKQDIVNANKC
jgi:hypothetical protein